MKYKLICIFTIIALLSSALILENTDIPNQRYHQHREAIMHTPYDNQGEETFSSHLPLIEVTTDGPIPDPYIYTATGERKPSTEKVSAHIRYFDNTMQNNHLSDAAAVSEQALFSIRGRSSRNFDKYSYAIQFKESDLVQNKDVSLSNMVADSDWVLHGPYLDKTLIRNYLSYNLAGEIMDYSPNVRFCELFLNGKYQGLYLLTEKIGQNDDGRVNITETNPTAAATSYILKLDEGTDDPLAQLNTFSYYTGKNGSSTRDSGHLEIIYPSKTLTVAQKKYIEDSISQFEKSLYSFDFTDRNLGYQQFLDVQSFVDYFILSEFTMNSDAMSLSTYFYKDLRGKINIAVWDFNSAFDNYVYPMSDPHYFVLSHKFWYKHLLKDTYFVDLVVKRYHQLRQDILSDEYLLNYIDDTIAYLGPAIERNYEVWGYTFEPPSDLLEPVERNPRSYDEAVQQLKDTIVERGAYLDEYIETLYALAHDSINKRYKH